MVLAAAIVMQMCLGATYSWTIFVQDLRQGSDLSQATAQIPFTVFYMVFPATMVGAGALLRRWGPRRCAMTGGLVFGGGWVVACLGKFHFCFTVIGVGLLGGVGVGLAYVVPIAVGMLWFPRHKGLVTGAAVAGFGGGSALVAYVSSALMHTTGVSAYATFGWLGLAFAVIVSLAGWQMGYPPGYAPVAGPRGGSGGVLRDRGFWWLYAAMFAGLAAGFTLNANLKQLSPTALAQQGAATVAIFAIANAAGRVSWGALFDRMRPGPAIRLNLLAQAGVLIAALWLKDSEVGLQLLAGGGGFCYGGVLTLYASTAARRWGVDRVGQVYGLLFSANIPAAAAPLAAGVFYDATGGFGAVFVGMAVLLVAACGGVSRACVGVER